VFMARNISSTESIVLASNSGLLKLSPHQKVQDQEDVQEEQHRQAPSDTGCGVGVLAQAGLSTQQQGK
jgi:hypothetical protein